jgi:hypothetical protein
MTVVREDITVALNVERTLDPVPEDPMSWLPLRRIPLLKLDMNTVLNAGRTVIKDLDTAPVGFPTTYTLTEVDIKAEVALLMTGS